MTHTGCITTRCITPTCTGVEVHLAAGTITAGITGRTTDPIMAGTMATMVRVVRLRVDLLIILALPPVQVAFQMVDQGETIIRQECRLHNPTEVLPGITAVRHLRIMGEALIPEVQTGPPATTHSRVRLMVVEAVAHLMRYRVHPVAGDNNLLD